MSATTPAATMGPGAGTRNLGARLAILREAYGPLVVLRLLLAPLTVAFTTPVRLVQALLAARVLFRGPVREYSHWNPFFGLVSLFYWRCASNLRRFGVRGRGPCLGLGSYRLARWFHITPLSLYAFRDAGAVVALAGMTCWWLSHAIWLRTTDPAWTLLVLALVLAGPTFYANAFGCQNYNALGWALFPLGLFALAHGHAALAGAVWFVVSFTSFTVTTVGGLLAIAMTILTRDPWLAVAAVPAGLKLATHLLPLLGGGEAQQDVGRVAKAIGLKDQRALYRYVAKKPSPKKLYYVALYTQLVAVAAYRGALDPLLASAAALWFLNGFVVRFADDWTGYLLMASAAAATALAHPDPWLLASVWLVLAPLPRFAGFEGLGPRGQLLDVVPRVQPFHVQPVLDAMARFLAPAQTGERVLFALTDPGDIVERVYLGIYPLQEVPFLVADEKGVTVFPDFWAVFDLNYEGAPRPWGTDPASVRANLAVFPSQWVLVTQAPGTALAPEWEAAGFTPERHLAWSAIPEVQGLTPALGELGDWYLLRS